MRCPLTGAIHDLATVRSQVRALLEGYGQDNVVDAVMVADELTNDAFRRGVPRELRLSISAEGTCVQIEVDTVEEDRFFEDAIAGAMELGRIVLEEATSRWGVHRHEHHITLWATLDLTSR